MRRTLPSKFSVMQSISPAVATIIGLFFGEVPTVVDIVGIGLLQYLLHFHQMSAQPGKPGPKGRSSERLQPVGSYFSLLHFVRHNIYQHKISPHSLRTVRAGG